MNNWEIVAMDLAWLIRLAYEEEVEAAELIMCWLAQEGVDGL